MELRVQHGAPGGAAASGMPEGKIAQVAGRTVRSSGSLGWLHRDCPGKPGKRGCIGRCGAAVPWTSWPCLPSFRRHPHFAKLFQLPCSTLRSPFLRSSNPTGYLDGFCPPPTSPHEPPFHGAAGGPLGRSCSRRGSLLRPGGPILRSIQSQQPVPQTAGPSAESKSPSPVPRPSANSDSNDIWIPSPRSTSKSLPCEPIRPQ